ncbi:MAG: TolC family protein, partial [Bacteroides sp.]|nr:TolC family protein [Bacteroides sp.]
MMKRNLFFLIMLAGQGVLFVQAQETKQWTLKECLEYALDNNIQLQQNRIALEESEVDVKSARASLFPSLSFSMGHNVTNRPYQENSNTVSG